jgi:hypothetical protein
VLGRVPYRNERAKAMKSSAVKELRPDRGAARCRALLAIANAFLERKRKCLMRNA